jgi:hypothetical protein
VLAGRFVVGGGEPGPSRQVLGTREAGHVAARFGYENLGGRLADFRDGLQQFDSSPKGAEPLGYLLVQERDVGIQEVDVAQDGPGNHGVVGADLARPGVRESRDLGTHLGKGLAMCRQKLGYALAAGTPGSFGHS